MLGDACAELVEYAEACGFIGVGPLTYAGDQVALGTTGTDRQALETLQENVMADRQVKPPQIEALRLARSGLLGSAVDGKDKAGKAFYLPWQASLVVDSGDVTAPTPLSNVFIPAVGALPALLHMRARICLDLPLTSHTIDHAKRLTECALALLRHIAHPSPTLRSRLLLTLGQLRSRAVATALTPAQAAWKPVDVPTEPPTDADPAGASDAKSGKGKKTGGRGKEVKDADVGEPEDSKAGSTVAGGLPRDHPLAACVSALEQCVCTAYAHAGHPHGLMREACIELVVLFGKCLVPSLREKHLNMSMQYLVFAADLAQQADYLATMLPIQTSDDPLSEDLLAGMPQVLRDELDLPSGEMPTVRKLVALHLSLQREAAADPFVQSKTRTSLSVILHDILAHVCELYKARCMQEHLPAITGDPIQDLPQDLVCLQWRICDASNGAPALPREQAGSHQQLESSLSRSGLSQSQDQELQDDQPQSESGAGSLRSHAEGFVLLGQSARFPKYAESRQLDTFGPVSIAKVQELQRRAAGFRYALGQARKDGLEASGDSTGKSAKRASNPAPSDEDASTSFPPAKLIEGWRALLCAVHMEMRPSTTNRWVRNGDLCYSDGTPVELDPSQENLEVLESLLRLDLGVKAASEQFCAWVRDIMDPVEA